VREPVGFRDSVAARQHALLRSGWLLTGDWQRAEDLLQSSLAKVWPHWTRVVAAGDPEAYVRRVQVTTFLTWRRRRWSGEEPRGAVPDCALGTTGTAGPSGTAGAIAATDAVDLREALTRALLTLPPEQRAVLVLRFYEDLSVEQTAAVLGCPVGTVKSQTARALDRLAALDVMEGIR
jgi:RNA polymerase sigma-70 factor (sigma-E family)